MKKEVAGDIRTIFNAPNRLEADRQLNIMMSKYEKTAPKLSKWMEIAIPEGLTIFNFKLHLKSRKIDKMVFIRHNLVHC